ncbi:MAG: hypothetical protein M1276_08945 [Deltaproteobacteria bacterium]|jgi:hypothetical protein|nr:hypothetical protein [Deltaproteobacteria bacterium]
MIILLSILIGIIIILIFFIDWGNAKLEFDLNDKDNIIGIGKASGVYLIKVKDHYIVAGIKIKNKRKAVKEFLYLVNNNGYLPPDMFFKNIKG